jgi:hypothetical protein
MEEIELIRAPGDRRLYELGTIGSLRLNGWLMRSATAQAGGDRFLLERASWSSAAVDAKDDGGQTIGTFRPRPLRRGGAITWRDAEYSLRPVAALRERYELVAGGHELAAIEARGWWGWGSRRPLKMTLSQGDRLDPGLLLLVAYVVRTLADKSSSDAGAASVATTTGAYGG